MWLWLVLQSSNHDCIATMVVTLFRLRYRLTGMLNMSSVPLNEAVYIYLLHIYTIHRTIILSTKKEGAA